MVCCRRRKKYEEALKHLEECLKIDPSHVEALQYLGACYNVLNKTHQVDNVFHKLITSDLPPSKLHTNFGIFLQEAGKFLPFFSLFCICQCAPCC